VWLKHLNRKCQWKGYFKEADRKKNYAGCEASIHEKFGYSMLESWKYGLTVFSPEIEKSRNILADGKKVGILAEGREIMDAFRADMAAYWHLNWWGNLPKKSKRYKRL